MFDPKRTVWAVLILCCALLVPVTAFAEEAKEGETEEENLDKVLVEVEAAFYSKYVWRGINIVDDWVLQANVDVEWRGFTFTGFGNIDLTDENGDRGGFSRLDLIADYGIDLDLFQLSVGAQAFLYPSTTGDTVEIYARGGLDVLFKPTLTIYRDIKEVNGFYIALTASHTFGGLFKLSEKFGLSPELRASLAWSDADYNKDYYRVDDSGFADLTVDFIVPWTLLNNFTVFASVSGSVLIDSAIRRKTDETSNLWFGFGASITF